MSFTMSKLDKPTNATGTLVAGGTLDVDTTYHYKIIATGPASSWVYTNILSEPSDIITKTTDSTNRTILLDWDDVPSAYRYYIIRIKDGDSFDSFTAMHLSTSASSPYMFADSTFTDSGWVYQTAQAYYENGMPHIIIDAGTTEEPDDLYDWAVANGYTDFVSRVVDKQHKRGVFYYITGDLVIEGLFKCATDSTLGSGMTIFIDGLWEIPDGGEWRAGYNPNLTDYNNEGIQIIRTGKYTVGYMRGKMNWQFFTYHDIGLYDRVYLPGPYLSQQIIRTSGGHPDISLKNGLWRYGPLEAYGSTIAIIEDCTMIGTSTGETHYFMKDCNYFGSRPIYNYYATSNLTYKGLKIKISAYEFFFHKHASLPAIFYTINCEWYNTPVKGVASANPTNMQVYDCKTFNGKMVDTSGNAIEGVTATITNTEGDVITMTSNSDGKFYLAAGNPTSATTTTITDTNLNLITDELKNKTLILKYGTNPTEYERVILSNTSDTITLAVAFPTTPSINDSYIVEEILVFNKYIGNGSAPTNYQYDLTEMNPFDFKFEKAGYTTEEINNYIITKPVDFTIEMKPPIVPAYENLAISYTEDSLLISVTDDSLSNTIAESSLLISVTDDSLSDTITEDSLSINIEEE